ncbi:family 1 glycosylhydrolase, partial [Escherichia coli]|uniref:family 1 glycosylhydrolase n=1 Tax=Escherichia coli TaxID=562 RepID=UPI00207C5130
MLEHGLDPWCTLYHWDLPQALQEQGGWVSRDTVGAFLDYTELVTRRLGDRVKHWITHNEPWCSCIMGYWEGVHA